jgi:hypothetical protein
MVGNRTDQVEAIFFLRATAERNRRLMPCDAIVVLERAETCLYHCRFGNEVDAVCLVLSSDECRISKMYFLEG